MSAVHVMNQQPLANVDIQSRTVDDRGPAVQNSPSNSGSVDNSGSFPNERPFETPDVTLGFPRFGLLDTSY